MTTTPSRGSTTSASLRSRSDYGELPVRLGPGGRLLDGKRALRGRYAVAPISFTFAEGCSPVTVAAAWSSSRPHGAIVVSPRRGTARGCDS